MGISIDAGVYDYNKLVTIIEDAVPLAVDVREMLDAIIPEFGVFVPGGDFVLIHNEYYDGYNPHHEFFEFINRYYGLSEEDEIYMYDFSIPGGANADDVADDLGVELQELQYEW